MFLIAVVPIRSYQYDPWTDLNSDGGIDGGDLSQVAAIFGTAGDPTRDVVVAGLSTYEWTGHKIVTPSNDWDFYNSTAGFRSVSIVAVEYTNSHVYVEVRFLIHGASMNLFTVADRLYLYNNYTVSKTYDVAGSQIEIFVFNSDTVSVDVSVGIYMTT